MPKTPREQLLDHANDTAVALFDQHNALALTAVDAPTLQVSTLFAAQGLLLEAFRRYIDALAPTRLELGNYSHLCYFSDGPS